jgi:hypothetical protein
MRFTRTPFAAVLTAVIVLSAVPASAALVPWKPPPPVPVPKEAVDSVLRSVTVISPGDLWVVGGWTSDVGHTLAVHWDGASWTAAQVPDTDATGEYGLNAVDATASNDVWAVGSITSRLGTTKTTPLLLHYDGLTWTEQQPTVLGTIGELTDVDMLTKMEGWAVGNAGTRPMILHRSLGQWSTSVLPLLPAQASLSSVFTVSATDAWAAGRQLVNGHWAGLVLHWDGVRWTVVPLPDAGGDESLSDIAAVSPSDVWAVGSVCSPTCQSRALHFSAGIWQPVATAPDAVLTSVVALSPADVWVFGQGNPTATILDHIEHWDGLTFTVDLSVPPSVFGDHPAGGFSLGAAAADPTGQAIWTVGWTQAEHKTPHALFRN